MLYGGKDKKKFAGFTLTDDFELRDPAGEPYAGELPYAVISLDGREQPQLEGWSATVATAALIERFFTSGDLAGKAIEVIGEGLALYNDVAYQDKAADALRRAKSEKDPAKKKKMEAQAQAYLKNLKNKELRDSVSGG